MSKLIFSYEKNGPDIFGELLNNLCESNVRFTIAPGGSVLTINILGANYHLDYKISTNNNTYTVEIDGDVKILKDIKHLIENIYSYSLHGSVKVAYIANFDPNEPLGGPIKWRSYGFDLNEDDKIFIDTLEIIK